jgi:xylose dehydrogenase (NAD/NADP)
MNLAEKCSSFSDRDWDSYEGTDQLRLAMVGLGNWTINEAIPAIKQSNYCTTTTVVSGNMEKANSIKSSTSTITEAISYDQLRKGVASENFDAVYICTPNAFHLDYAEAAAQLNKAILCEKPMEASLNRAEDMVATANQEDVPLMIAYRMHTEPAVRRAREMVREDLIGSIVQVHSHFSERLFEVNPDKNQWRLDMDLSGYGSTLMDLGPYPVNTVRFILQSDPIAVQATSASVSTGFEDIPDERISFLMELPNGTQANCSVSLNAYHSNYLRLIGKSGEIRIEPAFRPSQDRRLIIKKNGCRSVLDFEQINQMTEEFDYFATCVFENNKPSASGEMGLKDMKILKSIFESASKNQRITVS